MFGDPKINLEQFGLTKGMKVADLGVGSGFYAKEAAKLVGEEGRVFGVDVQKEIVENLKRSAVKENMDNLEVIWGDMEKVGGTKIKEGILDAVIATSVLFQVEDKENFVEEIKRIIKPGGRALVIDWMDSFGGLGPHRESVFTESQAENLFKGAGFGIENKIDPGDHHYGFIAIKNE
jgi:ubiquinone/menaquinone biosynthesis C-methylase UbiE